MAANALPPPPIQDKPGSFTWLEWYRQLRAYVSTSGSVPWYIINFAGSNITDIALRNHNQLQSLQGGVSNEYYHLTSAEYTALNSPVDHNTLDNIQGGTTDEYYHLTSTENNTLANSVNGTWTPSFTNLTETTATGVITKTGRYSRIGRTVFYQITISCTLTSTTASVAGTTYCDLPITAVQNDVVSVANGTTKIGLSSGFLEASTSRCYPSSWTATGNTIILSGKYEV